MIAECVELVVEVPPPAKGVVAKGGFIMESPSSLLCVSKFVFMYWCCCSMFGAGDWEGVR